MRLRPGATQLLHKHLQAPKPGRKSPFCAWEGVVSELSPRRKGRLAGPPPQAHPTPQYLPAPSGLCCPRNRWGRLGGGCGWWHRTHGRGTCPAECSRGPSTPCKVPRAEPPAAGPPAPPAPPRVSDAAHTDSGLACPDLPSLLNDFRDVITVEGDELERTGALKA